MHINFESEEFPENGPVVNGSNRLTVTWDELLWAAITVGRPSRYFVFRYGVSSLYEALFRLSAVRMAVEQPTPWTRTFRRTNAAKSLDPSEKGALHYFLGLTLCKLFADKLLNAPWLLHLDVFRARLNPTLLRGRSRPDLVGRTLDGNWIAMESKGRVSKPSAEDRRRAKEQARRIVAVRGVPVRWRIGGFAFFHDDVLKFTWRDPQPEEKEPRNAVQLDISEDDIWRKYYEPLLNLVGRNRAELMLRETEPLRLEEADFSIRIEPPVLKFLLAEQWSEAGRWCVEHHQQLAAHEARRDGVRIIAGQSWSKPHEDVEE